MAVAFEMVTKIPADMWLRLQKSYDEFIARKKREKSLKEGMRWAKKFPYAEISSLGWFSGINDVHGDEKNIVDTLCTFFAVSSPKGWEDTSTEFLVFNLPRSLKAKSISGILSFMR